MKKLKDYDLTNKEWRHVKACFVRFYKTQSKCGLTCPMQWGETDIYRCRELAPKINTAIKDKTGYYWPDPCVCSEFIEFKKLRKDRGCPCELYGEKAFIQLEKLIKRLIAEGEIKG